MLKLVAKHIRESILLAHSHTGGERVSQKTDSPLAVLLWTNLCIAKTETVHVPFNRVIVVPQLSASAGRIRATISTGCAQRNRSFALNVKSGRGPTDYSQANFQSQIQRRTSGTLISSIVTEPNRCGLRPTDAARIFRVGRLVPWNLSVSPQP